MLDLVWWLCYGVPVLAALALVAYWYSWKDYDPATMPSERFAFQKDLPADYLTKPSEEKFAVIGAGFCGLGISSALRRHAIPFETLEATDAIGGNWTHGVYETVHIISSRRTTEYKDMPMPADWPEFPSAKHLHDYLHSYAERYQLRPHIRLGQAVQRLDPVQISADGTQCKWRVTFAGGETRVYKGVIVAIGHHWDRRMPSYEGQAAFAGQLLHSKDYKSPESLRGKRVLVVGGGNSACDIAVEAARFAVYSHCSMRRGYWFMPRSMFGRPMVELLPPWTPMWLQRIVLRITLGIMVGDYRDYGLQQPDHKIFEHHPTINSELLHYLKLGRIAPHPDIRRFAGGNTVEFVDGKRADFDLVIFATGYHIGLPMLSHIVEYRDGIPQLTNGILHPHLRNVYVFGIGQVRYGAGPMITVGADSLCRTITMQDRLRYPIAWLLRSIGSDRRPRRSRKSADILVDPHRVYRDVSRSNMFLPWMPTLERFSSALGWLPPKPDVVAAVRKYEGGIGGAAADAKLVPVIAS